MTSQTTAYTLAALIVYVDSEQCLESTKVLAFRAKIAVRRIHKWNHSFFIYHIYIHIIYIVYDRWVQAGCSLAYNLMNCIGFHPTVYFFFISRSSFWTASRYICTCNPFPAPKWFIISGHAVMITGLHCTYEFVHVWLAMGPYVSVTPVFTFMCYFGPCVLLPVHKVEGYMYN